MFEFIIVVLVYLILGLGFMKFIVPRTCFSSIIEDLDDSSDYMIVFASFISWPIMLMILLSVFVMAMLGRIVMFFVNLAL